MVSLLVGILIAAVYIMVAFCIYPILGVFTLLFFYNSTDIGDNFCL